MSDIQELFKKNHWSLHCNLCGKDVFKHPLDYYMLKDEIWKKITDNNYISSTDILCRYCAEQILGRKFVDEDFMDVPINYDYKDDETRILKNKIFKMDIKKTIAISEFDNKRCSRNCDYCIKTNGNYRCYLNSTGDDWQEIEGFAGYDDVEAEEYEDADTYGFKRTDYCLKTFGER